MEIDGCSVEREELDLSIVIVNYKTKEKLRKCLESLRDLSNHNFSYEITLVENGSREDLQEFFNSSQCRRMITSHVNEGLARGNNWGINGSDAKYILVINPDIEVTPGSVKILLDYLVSHPTVAVVGPKQVNLQGELQYSCLRLPRLCMPILRRTFLGRYFPEMISDYLMALDSHDKIREVDWLTGSALMFRKTLKLKKGKKYQMFFDDRYFMYYEDTDFCRTAWRKGYKVVYNPRAVFIHECARQTARYPWYQAIFRDELFRIQIASCLKYFLKWGLKTGR